MRDDYILLTFKQFIPLIFIVVIHHKGQLYVHEKDKLKLESASSLNPQQYHVAALVMLIGAEKQL